MLCTKFGWNFVNIFKLFRYHLPLEKDLALHLYKLEFPSHKVALYQDSSKLTKWFWRSFVNVYLIFPNYLLLEKGVALYLKKLESFSTKVALCQVWLKLAHCFWREDENVKSLQWQRRQWWRLAMDKLRSGSSFEPWAYLSLKIFLKKGNQN